MIQTKAKQTKFWIERTWNDEHESPLLSLWRNNGVEYSPLLLRCSLLRAAGDAVWAAARLADLCLLHEGHPRLHGGSPAGGQSVRLVSQPHTAHRGRGVAAGVYLGFGGDITMRNSYCGAVPPPQIYLKCLSCFHVQRHKKVFPHHLTPGMFLWY